MVKFGLSVVSIVLIAAFGLVTLAMWGFLLMLAFAGLLTVAVSVT